MRGSKGILRRPENALTVLFGREDAGLGDGVEQLLFLVGRLLAL